MRERPYVSVIMACHNAEPYVGDAIRSVLAQSFTELELVFVDDRSTDDSLRIARTLAKSDARIRIYETGVNSGAAVARNRAIAEARGEWLAILDADDVFVADKLEKQVDLVRGGRERLVLVGTGCIQVDASGRALASYRYPASSDRLKDHLLRWKPFPPHSSIMYRASAVRDAGGFNGRFCPAEDYDLWLQLHDAGDFAAVPEPLIEYRRHQTNISNAIGKTGYSQLDRGVAATVCHLLRRAGEVDPSRAGDDRLWAVFMEHVASETRAAGEAEYRRWKGAWRDPYGSRHGAVARGAVALRELALNPRNAWRLVLEHSVGNRLPARCLESWLKTVPCAVS
jgi:glycosyltransferase involved in cell wall biosynthesis